MAEICGSFSICFYIIVSDYSAVVFLNIFIGMLHYISD